MIEDDMNWYRDDETRRWPVERYDALRDEAIDHILQLRTIFDARNVGDSP